MMFNHAQSVQNRRQRIAADITSQLPPGVFNLSIDQTALVLGCHPGHIRNQLSEGTFSVETITLGSRRYIPLTNLIDYLCGLMAPIVPIKIKRRRGPRTKAENRLLREQQAHAEAQARA